MNWFTDDRDEQASLLGDEAATRTKDREGTVVTGSDAFADDRDHDDQEKTEQAGLFQQESELDGQASLTGGQASQTESEGFFDESDGGGAFDLGFSGPTADTPVSAFEDDVMLDVNGGRDERELTGTGLSPEDFEMPPEPRFGKDTTPSESEKASIAADLADVQAEESRRLRISDVEQNVAAAESAGVLTPDGPNGDSEHAPEGLFSPEGAQETGAKTEITFGSRTAANEARESIPDEARTGRYDGRHKTVEVFDERLGERRLNRLSRRAADSRRAEAEKSGQASLTDAEKERIDFSSLGVFEARSIKGIMQSEGVDDWTSYVDETLSVEEHRQVAKRASRDEVGARMDSRDTEGARLGREADAFAKEQRGLEDHAIKGAEAGEQEAVETLVVELGWDRSEARALAQATDDPKERGELVRAAIVRAKSHGRFMTEPAPAPNSAGMRKPSTGRYVGNDFEEPDIGRRESGQFTRI